MTIKNIVINGGGITIFNIYGALRDSNKNGLWKHDNIDRYFGTSAGAIMALIVVLNYPWEDLDNFIFDRPWNTVFKFNIINIFEYYINNGILGIEYVYDIFTSLFKGKDIETNITFSEFHTLTGKSLYFYATDLNSFDVVELSHETSPDMKILDGVYASACLPIMCRPLKVGNTHLMDGFLCNYPISMCYNKIKSLDETLGIHNNNVQNTKAIDYENMNMGAYLSSFIDKFLNKYQNSIFTIHKPKYEIALKIYSNDIYQIISTSNDPAARKKLVEDGAKDAIDYIASISENHDEQIAQDSPK
jgi:predicted acylesterase/phospholipase RssA